MTPQTQPMPSACARLEQKHTTTYTNAGAFDGWEMDYTQLSRGRYECVSREFRLPGLQIFVESGNSTVHQSGLGRPNTYVFGLPLAMAQEGTFNGRRWHQCVTVSRSERVLDAVVPPMSLLVVAIDRDMLSDYLWSVDQVSVHDWLAKTWLLVEDRALCQRVAGHLAAMFEACAVNPSAFDHEPSRRAIEHAAMESVTPLIQQNLAPPPPSYGEFSRVQVVRRAREFVLQHVDEPLQIVDVCRALGVSRRTLQYSFQETLNVNPVAYLRLLRLNGARRDLMMAPETSVQVKDVAARWGFWHLSRFSAEYREMFHELPSETLIGGLRAPHQ